jgi:hypothetical protein
MHRSFVCLALLTTACVNERARVAQPPPYAYPPPYQGAPQAPPPPFATVPPAPQLGGVRMNFRLPPPAPSPGIIRSINVQALLSSLTSSPCAPAEMSPGNWVGFDCTPPSFSLRALPFMPARRFSDAELPPAVDHRFDSQEGPVKNQGAVGTCTAVSLSSAMEHTLRTMSVTENVSALHIWSQYSVPQMGTAGDSTVDKHLAADLVWPYDPAQACKMMRRSFDSCGPAYGVASNSADADPVIRAKRQAADGSGKFRLVGIEKLATHDPDTMAALLLQGDDLWVAFNINRNNWKTSQMVDHVIQDYVITEATGHAVVLAGYRTVNGRKQFLIHNSWGESWGDRGYAWISEDMVRSQLRYAYRVKVATGDAPPGLPQNAGGCPEGQLKDVVWAQCAPVCDDGGPRAAGVCVPGLPRPPAAPAPAPGKACASGQAPDALTGQCAAVCSNGAPQIGGLCLPQVQ